MLTVIQPSNYETYPDILIYKYNKSISHNRIVLTFIPFWRVSPIILNLSKLNNVQYIK